MGKSYPYLQTFTFRNTIACFLSFVLLWTISVFLSIHGKLNKSENVAAILSASFAWKRVKT